MSKGSNKIAAANHNENIQHKDGKIFNATIENKYDYLDFHSEVRYSIKEGKLEGVYECKSYTGDSSSSLDIMANFKEGILDGPFSMHMDGHCIKAGYYDDGIFHGEDFSKMYPATAEYAERMFSHHINDIQKECLNQPQIWRFDDCHLNTVDVALTRLRCKLAKKIDNVFGTKLRKKKLAKPLEKVEKAVSDKLFGKGKE